MVDRFDFSGTIALDGDLIRYKSVDYGEWELALRDIRLIGEATNQNGPAIDDWFFCFAPDSTRWYEASVYAAGRDAFLDDVSKRLGHPMTLALANSADFASRILWPPEYVGQPMFAYDSGRPPPKGWLGKLLGRRGPVYQEFLPSPSRR